MKENGRKFMFFVGFNGYHGFYVNKSNQTFGFGFNASGQLNVRDKENRLVPEVVEFFNGEEFLNICIGEEFSVFQTNRRVVSCGCWIHGQTSLVKKEDCPIAEKVILEDEEAKISDVSVGMCSTFFLCSGRVYLAGSTSHNKCYGLGDNLLIGDINALFFSENEIFVGGAKRVGLAASDDIIVKLYFFKERGLSLSSVVPGVCTVFFLCGNNEVYISEGGEWNNEGQSGRGTYEPSDANQPVLSSSIKNVDICGSGYASFVWRDLDGRIFGTGCNGDGTLGLGETRKVNVPTLIPMSFEGNNSIGEIASGVLSTYFIVKEVKVSMMEILRIVHSLEEDARKRKNDDISNEDGDGKKERKKRKRN